MKDYALFLTLKSKYRNSTYKNFSLNKLSKDLGVSYYYLKGALSRLNKDGAVRYEYNHLVLVKQKRLSDALDISYLTNFEVDARSYKVDDVLVQIKKVLLSSTHNRLKWRSKRTLTSDKKFGQGSNANSDTWYEDFSDDFIQISYKGLAKLWGCSIGSAFNQIKRWVNEDEIKKERSFKVISDLDPWVVTEARESGDYSFFINGFGEVTKVMPNKYFFSV